MNLLPVAYTISSSIRMKSVRPPPPSPPADEKKMKKINKTRMDVPVKDTVSTALPNSICGYKWATKSKTVSPLL